MQNYKSTLFFIFLLVSQISATGYSASLIGGAGKVANDVGKMALATNAGLKTAELVKSMGRQGAGTMFSIAALIEGGIIEASAASLSALVTGTSATTEVAAIAAGKLIDASVARGIAEIEIILAEAIAASLATLNGAAIATTGIVKGAARSIDTISSSTANQVNLIVDGAAAIIDHSLDTTEHFINIIAQLGETSTDVAADVSSGILRSIGNTANLASILLTHY